jgi:hypothetical protein
MGEVFLYTFSFINFISSSLQYLEVMASHILYLGLRDFLRIAGATGSQICSRLFFLTWKFPLITDDRNLHHHRHLRPLTMNTHTLTSYTDWPNWYIDFQFQAMRTGVWDLVNPDAPDFAQSKSAPKPPAVFSSDPKTAEVEWEIYEMEREDWNRKEAHIYDLHKWVQSTVHRSHLHFAIVQLV